MKNRKLAAQETKKKLLLAGRQIISEKGLANTSVEEITAAAGVCKGTFYTYFQRKEDILYEISGFQFYEILDHAKCLDGSFYEKFRTYMIDFSDYIEKGSVRMAQEWIRNGVNPPITETSAGLCKWRLDASQAEELFRIGISEGQLKEKTPAKHLAHILTELLYGELLCWCINDGSYSLRERTEEFCDTELKRVLEPYEEEM